MARHQLSGRRDGSVDRFSAGQISALCSVRTSRSERGSTLMLVPAAVLVLLLLGALALDTTAAFSAQRELTHITDAAANDAAAAALDREGLVGGGPLGSGEVIQIDAATAQRLAEMAVAKSAPKSWTNVAVTARVTGGGRILEVRATALAPTVFGDTVPGMADRVPISATSHVELRVGF